MTAQPALEIIADRDPDAARPGVRMQRSFGTGRIVAKSAPDGATRLQTLYQEGSARIRLPNSHSNGRLEAVLLNTSGGMTGGDRMSWNCEAGPGTHLTLASQTAERLYRAPQGRAETTIRLDVKEDAALHWLAQETIAFDGAAFSRTIDCDLSEGASLLVCEPLIFGRGAMNERVRTGTLRDRWTVRQAGRPVHVEALRLNGAIDDKLQSAAVARGAIAHASVLLVGPQGEALEARARAIVGDAGGASYVGGKLVVRMMAGSALALRRRLVPLLIHLRGGYALPRCWSV
ncbi:urease accessory protein UreD [Fulvimarina sp. 2208YS6-2-32]|uniref:Urease accessory protein UreD n=1 Tax=Fulvimarina uroteuthidis TaxID=3098149 RepID=A0ABU5I224_9HYPH|nr:urease accessory protein UreD [Fulvimarina sp. 2208YS6-2-32]MDY8109038.1 urease accessory protein UreD [Fulvimarina sp. 2208YS6-2-32]